MFAGWGLGGLLIVVGWLSGLLRDVPWPFWAVIPGALLTVISFADRDGWNIRRAMAYVAIQQWARWTRGRIPRTPSLAQAWLHDPANAEADDLEKASMFISIGNLAAARAQLVAYVPATDLQRAATARMRSYLAARETGVIDMGPIHAASEGLSEDDRRYQLTSAAWMQAWMDIEARRPWRQRFAEAVRELGPYPVPSRVLAFIGMQQLAAPIATVLATGIIAFVLG